MGCLQAADKYCLANWTLMKDDTKDCYYSPDLFACLLCGYAQSKIQSKLKWAQRAKTHLLFSTASQLYCVLVSDYWKYRLKMCICIEETCISCSTYLQAMEVLTKAGTWDIYVICLYRIYTCMYKCASWTSLRRFLTQPEKENIFELLHAFCNNKNDLLKPFFLLFNGSINRIAGHDRAASLCVHLYTVTQPRHGTFAE